MRHRRIATRIPRHRGEAIARRMAASGPPAGASPCTSSAPPPSNITVSDTANSAVAAARTRRPAVTPLDAVRQTPIEQNLFKPSLVFNGAFPKFVFTNGALWVGYYRDELPDSFLRLPLDDLISRDSNVACVSRSWGCVDADMPDSIDG